MRLSRPQDRAATDATRAQIAAAARLRDAFAALIKDAKASRIYAGSNIDTGTARNRFQNTYLGGMRDALTEVAMISLEITPDAMFFGDAVVVEGSERRGDMLEVLFSEGLRALSIEAGASDEELMSMAGLMLIPWHEMGPEDPDLATSAWKADFAHVFFEVVDGLADSEAQAHGESPVVREVLGLVKEMNARAKDSDEFTRMRQDEFAVMLRLQDQISLGESHQDGEGVRVDTTISPTLAAEVRACRDNSDLDGADIAGLLTACVRASRDPERARIVGEALFSFLVNMLPNAGDPSRLVHRAAELLDPHLTPDLPHQEAVRDAAATIAQEPLRSRLGRLFAEAGKANAEGVAFSLCLLLPGEDDAISLAETLPPWALRVLSDTVLLRASPEMPAAAQVPRRFLISTLRGAQLIGLSMAARLAEPALIEFSLALVTSPADDVREAALVALRMHQTPRIRDAVRNALGDVSERVRLEAMRICVAYHDASVAPQFSARLVERGLADASVAEVRALCIAYARLAPSAAEPLLSELALRKREPAHPELPRLALHGLRAAGTPTARSVLGRVQMTHPEMADEIRALLAHDRVAIA